MEQFGAAIEISNQLQCKASECLRFYAGWVPIRKRGGQGFTIVWTWFTRDDCMLDMQVISRVVEWFVGLETEYVFLPLIVCTGYWSCKMDGVEGCRTDDGSCLVLGWMIGSRERRRSQEVNMESDWTRVYEIRHREIEELNRRCSQRHNGNWVGGLCT